MKFTSAIVYSIMPGGDLSDLEKIEEALQAQAFVPCTPSQSSSVGFVPPREKNGVLAEAIGGELIVRIAFENRSVPGSAVKTKLDERCAQIEAATGRKPGKKEKKELKEDITHELLPMAFSKHSSVTAWIDRTRAMLVLDTTSMTKADAAVTELVKALGIAVAQFNTVQEPASAMAGWLGEHEAPQGFTIDRECELRATDESKSVVRYAKHALDTDEVRQHIAAGKRPTRLAMTWDDRVSFQLTDAGMLRSIALLEGTEAKGDGSKADDFDADAVIITGELGQLFDALFAELGGLAQLALTESEPAAAAAVHLEGDGPDPLFEQAVTLVRGHEKASISLVQRYLAIGYNRAARLIEDMESAGIVSRMDGSGQRNVLQADAAGAA